MEQFPLVSIVCLCYNHAPFVVDSLNSVVNQHYEPIEIIIVDDCSTDNSVGVIEAWLADKKGITFIKNPENLGNTKSFNKALKMAKGDYIIDLATDDLLMPNSIVKQVEKFNTTVYENVGIVYANASLIDEKGVLIAHYFNTGADGTLVNKRAGGDEYLRIITGGDEAMCTVTAMVKKKCLTNWMVMMSDWLMKIWTFGYGRLASIDSILSTRSFFKKGCFLTHWVLISIEKKQVIKKINASTYHIIQKVYHLNRTPEEDRAILKRLHYEMLLNFKNSYYLLVFKYTLLELKIRWRLLLK